MNTVRHKNPATFRRTAAAGAVAVLAASLGLPALAQDSQQQLERVEITGSSIKRIEGETALPVTVIGRDLIDKAGVTTAAELLTKVSASAANLTDGASFSDISGQRGFNGANLRGIGVSSTLVLLNGRRVANFASPGGASGVDLNSIPAAAIQRVEVLRDGASAIYGTDAIGGVINFITRQDYQGVDLYAYYGDTQHGGADKTIVTASGGVGDINKDGYNLFAVLEASRTGALRSSQRDWIGSVYQPDINLDVGSSNTFPANVRRVRVNADGSTTATGGRFNPSAPGCNPPANIYEPGSFVGPNACLFDYMQDTEIFPKQEKLSLLSRGEFKLGDDHTLFGEVLLSSTESTYRISALTITNLDYPATGQHYPTGVIPGYTGALRVGMRLSEAGGRTNEVDARTGRFVVGAKGTLADWDYNTALNYSESRVTDAYIDGYVQTDTFNAAFATGTINPFGPSTQAGLELLNSTKIRDDARKSKGSTTSFDVRASRELFQMDGGSAALALGFESRREDLEFRPSELLAAGQIRGDGAAQAFDGSRTVNAVFAELNLPVLKSLEAQLALRHDRYSDVGGTTNPKVGLRWAPAKEVVVRGSFGTGFRAPTLADLYTPARLGQTNGIYDDFYCAQAVAIDPGLEPDYCGLQPDKQVGGSTDLKPEESKQFSAGFVFEPNSMFTGSLDYWNISKTNTIVSPEGLYFSDPVRYAQYITRGPEIVPGLPGPIVEIDGRLRNAGALKTSGIDLGLELRGIATEYARLGAFLNGTYVLDYKTQDFEGAEYVNGVGRFAGDQVVQRWRHTLGLTVDAGPFSAAAIQTFYAGYTDQNPMPDGSDRKVPSYQLWDLSGSYQASKALKFRAGIKNIFDKNPPASNQVYFFLAGFDPSYTDVRGRFFYGSVQYSFR
ncbi:TonB-dependent receptor [Rivibacter subsaxonicus]|uniref:Iron complex outermembrane receptor protein n=1 Tax=Rivibacter subsaxonicus TaxID=457575 RepID=A0A4Q7W1B1_9BURK|nr:TonB-dependent receptor [Rivibacter subsaxonicus]RZU02625.1 iron complex outermembrane receptor protein [Rivibacter subsaxonicus]